MPMTPQATRPPASPVGCDFRSSAFSCTMKPRPMIDFSPLIVIILSVNSRCALPEAVGHEVAQVADVARLGVVAGVRIVGRVEMAAGRRAVRRGAVAKFVDVEAVLARGEAGDVGHDFHAVAGFGEGDGAFNLAPLGRVEDGDGFGGFLGESRGGEGDGPGHNQAESHSVECEFLHRPSYAQDGR